MKEKIDPKIYIFTAVDLYTNLKNTFGLTDNGKTECGIVFYWNYTLHDGYLETVNIKLIQNPQILCRANAKARSSPGYFLVGSCAAVSAQCSSENSLNSELVFEKARLLEQGLKGTRSSRTNKSQHHSVMAVLLGPLSPGDR